MRRMRKKSNRFSRLGMLSVALLLALCVTGVGYAAWTDTAVIDGTMEMGHIEVELSEGVSSENVTASIVYHTIHLGINAGCGGDYQYLGFDIHNIGTLPVRIQDITIDCPGLRAEVSGVGVGTQIEQSGVDPDTVYGTVTMSVPGPGAYTCEVTFDFVQWNLYQE
ncbi:MAG: hypothetical protein OEV57_03485 [Dehalococcoidia bacterium]|nr:hypothetical protein [Dehalococcoidia bacterium]